MPFSLSLCVSVYECVRVHVPLCAEARRGPWMLCATMLHLIPFDFWALTESGAGLVTSISRDHFLSLPSGVTGTRVAMPSFYVGAVNHTQVLTLEQQAPIPTDHLPNPLFYFSACFLTFCAHIF